jgi:hypothetical protein
MKPHPTLFLKFAKTRIDEAEVYYVTAAAELYQEALTVYWAFSGKLMKPSHLTVPLV